VSFPAFPHDSVGGGALEGDSNTRTLQIPVTLSQPSHFTVTVHYSLRTSAPGAPSAASGVDFSPSRER
jgi:hypothetical protein